MKQAIILSVLVVTIAGCEPEWEDPYEQFIIPKGKHSQGIDLQFLQSNVLSFQAIFNETAIYESKIPENQWDINKLLGFADCNSHHHQHSARFGWRWLDDNLEIFAYCYADGERMSEMIGILDLNKPGDFRLELTDDAYVFTLNHFPAVTMPRKNTCDKGAYYMLWPYFGGDEVAPHDIDIRLKISN